MHASRLFIVFILLFRVYACLFYATRNKDDVDENSSIHAGGDNPIEVKDDIDPYPGVRIHVGGDTLHQEDRTAKEMHDDIAEAMWTDYQCAIADRMDLDGGNFDVDYLSDVL